VLHQIKLTYGRRCCGCTNIPHPAGGTQEAGTTLSVGGWSQQSPRFGHLDPAGL